MPRGLSAYTPLETLLLFQYLSVYGINGTAFGKISDLLKKDPLVRAASNFEAGRLSPDALRDIFLRLLKDETRNELNSASGQESDHQSGQGQAGSRKRKAPSPSLPTIQDVLKDAHLIPQLITKLYARFREQTVGQIKEEERKYQKLRHDIDALEKGEWDAKLEQELSQGRWDDRLRWVIGPRKAQMNGTATATLDKSGSSPTLNNQTRPSRSSPTTTPKRPRSPQPQLPRPPVYSPVPPLPPAQPSPYAANPYAQHAPPGLQAGSLAPVGPQHSPGIVPLAGSPTPSHAGQNFPPYPYSTNNAQTPVQSPHMPYASAANQQPYVHPPAGAYYPPYANQPGHLPHSPPPYPPHLGGRQLSPFQVAPQTPQSQKHQQQDQAVPASVPARPSPELTTPVKRPSPHGRQSLPAQASPALHEIGRLLNTPSPRAARTAVKRPNHTPWRQSSLSKQPTKVKSPTTKSSDVSPVSETALSPAPPSEPGPKRATRQSKPCHATASIPEANGPPARSTRAAGKRVRGGSAASSAVASSVRGRTRSQSVLSHVSVDNESTTGRKVKAEPATPAEIPDSVRATVENTPSSGQRPLPQLNVNKRKRSLRGMSEASDTPATLRPSSVVLRNDMITAVKNFPRLSHSIMDSIQSHKHASLFAAPVREKDAEGYHEYIKQPQDLKSIRTAIQAGAKAVNASAAEMTPSNGPSSREASMIVLPMSDDIVPPKGIVNSAQLEKEVMRMFANAVMFNPGEDELVQDAREMAESTAVNLAAFRSAERTNVGGAADTAAGRTRRAESEVDEPGGNDGRDGSAGPDAIGAGTGPPASKRKRVA